MYTHLTGNTFIFEIQISKTRLQTKKICSSDTFELILRMTFCINYFFLTLLYLVQGHGELKAIPAFSGGEAGDTQHRSPFHHRATQGQSTLQTHGHSRIINQHNFGPQSPGWSPKKRSVRGEYGSHRWE